MSYSLLRALPTLSLAIKPPSLTPFRLHLNVRLLPKFKNPKLFLHKRTISSSVSASETTLGIPNSSQSPSTCMDDGAALRWVNRTAFCGKLSEIDVGKRVHLCGWVALHRIHGGLTFLNLRDHTGIVQVPFLFLFHFGYCIILLLMFSC